MKLLLDNGAKVNIQDKHGAAPLHRAAAKGNLSTTELLLKSEGIKIDIQDNLGQTPLYVFFYFGFIDFAFYLFN